MHFLRSIVDRVHGWKAAFLPGGYMDRRRRRVADAHAGRKKFAFFYRFADGTVDGAVALTPGDARAEIKRARGGKLPRVIEKRRTPVDPVAA